MSARAIWQAELTIGRQRIPVKLYSAVQDHAVQFHLLDRKTRHRVKQRMVDPDSGREVEQKEIRRGYEIEPGTLVVLDDDELEALEPEPSREIELMHFLPSGEIHHQWYERPYYLAPSGNAGAYYALAAALAKQNREGLASWVMRKKQYFGSLRSEGSYLVLITLRTADEVLLPKQLPAQRGHHATKTELKMAERLISMLEGSFRPEEFHDEYNERLQSFLKARAKGRKPKLARLKTRTAGKSLERDLARSLEAMERSGEKTAA